jgi:hypothetical protein
VTSLRAFAIGSCVLAGEAAPLTRAGQTSTNAGAYTDAQADRGQKTFASQYARCHEPARFTNGFIEAWAGETAFAICDAVRITMPEDNPRSLRPQQYADVLA